jgi:hypothetical protein
VDRLQEESRQSTGETDSAHAWEDAEIRGGRIEPERLERLPETVHCAKDA